MATISFYARGDSNTANNAALNAMNIIAQPTTEITFSSGTDGDLVLEPNGGLPDPDTTVIIDGVEMTFTVEFSGYLPTSNKLSDVNGLDLRGEPITVITAEDGTRLFFLNDGHSIETLDAFPNGAHDLTGLDYESDVPVCFVEGSMIETPDGAKPVESLTPGDLVLTEDGRAVPLLWKADRHIPAATLRNEPKFRPVCIPAESFGPGMPQADLWLSPQHRVLFRGWEAELLFQSDTVFFPASSFRDALGGPTAEVAGGVRYFHLLFAQHEIVRANNLPVESLYPGDQALASLTEEARQDLRRKFPSFGPRCEFYGPLAAPAVTRREGAVLLGRAVDRIPAWAPAGTLGSTKLAA